MTSNCIKRAYPPGNMDKSVTVKTATVPTCIAYKLCGLRTVFENSLIQRI